ncbi:hypothetical protein [Bradyrhizobium sp. I1.14.4]|uniref:hypothetical protein n=1 Tax=unclassified Bradyrhizobium TaxID=2631580 RepID=UPI003D1C02D4
MRCNAVERFAFELNGAGADRLKTRQYIDKGGFPGPVRANQPDDAAPRYGQGYVGQCFQAFELDADVASDQFQTIGHHLNAFPPATDGLIFPFRRGIVKFEISFADIGNFYVSDVPSGSAFHRDGGERTRFRGRGSSERDSVGGHLVH